MMTVGTKENTTQIGMIYPPPDIRTIVDKTAIFVKKNGLSFEKKILRQQASDAKFNFMKPTDPYYSYYQAKLRESQENTDNNSEFAVQKITKKTNTDAMIDSSNGYTIAVITESFEEPCENVYSVRLTSGLTRLELDTIKLSAQFTARNGKSFLSGLFQREQNNPLFAFIRPSNSLYPLFTDLIDAYQKILMPTQKIQEILSQNFENHDTVLTRCLKRLENKVKADLKNFNNELSVQDYSDLNSVNWHNFTVVENIEFLDDEDEVLPAPLTRKEIILLNREQINGDYLRAEKDLSNHKTHTLDESNSQIITSKGYPLNIKTETIKVLPDKTIQTLKDTNSSIHKTTNYLQSPMTGEMIPVDKVSEHMRNNLVDPKYNQQVMLTKIKRTSETLEVETDENLLS